MNSTTCADAVSIPWREPASENAASRLSQEYKELRFKVEPGKDLAVVIKIARTVLYHSRHVTLLRDCGPYEFTNLMRKRP
jgi:hypothetical protein